MSNRLYTTEGLVLKTNDYKENARLVTLLTPGHGKLSTIAKGVNQKNSKMRSIIQSYVYGEFQLYRGKNLHTITQGKVFNYFSRLREDLEKMYTGAYILEVLEKITIEAKDENVFFLGLSSLYLLNRIKNNKDNKVILLFFQVKVLENLGLSPYLDGCIYGHEIGNKIGFSLLEGGTMCERCMASNDKTYQIQKGNYKILVFLQKASLKELTRLKISASQSLELWKLLNDFIEEQTNIELKSKRFLLE